MIREGSHVCNRDTGLTGNVLHVSSSLFYDGVMPLLSDTMPRKI